jgi:lysophospholipase L1-like esterase
VSRGVGHRGGFALAAASLVGGALIGGQALYTTRRRDLPTVRGADASGTEGDPSLPGVHLGCAGDSTLTGPGLDDPSHIWIRQALRAVAHERHLVVRSWAVGGARVADVLEVQLDPLLWSSPDVAVIAVGSNDAIHWTPLGEVEAAFRTLLAALTRHVPQVVVGGVGDLGAIARVPWPLSELVSVRARQVNRVIRRTIEGRRRVRYVDVSTADGAFRRAGRTVFSDDLFHPNRDGHAIWAGVAGPVLAHAVRSVPVRRSADDDRVHHAGSVHADRERHLDVGAP